MTDQNIVISESVLKRYDIKLRDWVFDNINDAKTTSITKKFTILTSEWSRDKATKDIEISEDYDILVSLPVGEQYIDNSIEAAASGITVIGHDGTNLIIKYLNRKPTTDIILQVTARKQGIALDVDGNIDLTDYAKKTDLPDISALATKEELNDKVDNYYTKAEVDDSFSQLDDEYVKSDDTTLVKLENLNEINLQEDHYNAWFGYRGGKVTNWKFGDGTEGGLADVYANDFYLNDEKLSDILEAKANDADAVHKTGTEVVDGYKSFLKRIAVTPTEVGTTGYTIIVPFTRGDTTISSTSHATFRVQDKDSSIISEICTENHTDGNVLQSFNIRNTSDSGEQVSSTLVHSFNKDASNDTFYANRPSVVSLGNLDHKWSDVQTEKINGDTVVTPTYLETYLENKAEEWEFTLSDGLSITKKIVIV